MFTKIIKWREIARFFKEIRKNLRDIYKKRERQIALSLSVGGGYLLSHFRSTIGVVRLNFSVRNGKRWDPHAITTLVRFSVRAISGFCRTCDKVERNLWKRWLEPIT